MMRSLFSAVSGLKAHQQRMDVIGNNIANVNTPGFKKSQVTFQDMLTQLIRGASRPVENSRGGTNPMQVGLGVTLGAINTVMTAGNLQDTGKNTDLAIEGDGFFIVSDNGSNRFYTRTGAFGFDSYGYLVDPNGMHVMGWNEKNGVITIDRNNLEHIKINLNATAPAKATEKMEVVGNLDSGATAVSLQQTIYDSLGNKYNATIYFERKPDGQWDWKVKDITDSDGVSITSKNGTFSGSGTINFNGTGKLTSGGTGTITFDPDGNAGYLSSVTINLDLSKLTQYASETTVAASQDGYPAGDLQSVSFDTTGTLSGVFSNGVTRPLAQVALASFNNPAGLMKEGNSLFVESNNSGTANVGAAGTGGLGTIRPGSLEMSNVDLAEEFTNMIITQRGFQANSRVITASDEMLQDLVNLKR